MDRKANAGLLVLSVTLLAAGSGLALAPNAVIENNSNSATIYFTSIAAQWEDAACFNNAFAMNDVSAQPFGGGNNAIRLVGQGYCDYGLGNLPQTSGTYRITVRWHRFDCGDPISAIQILWGLDPGAYRFIHSVTYASVTLFQDTSQANCPFSESDYRMTIRDFEGFTHTLHIWNPLGAVAFPYTANTDVILDSFTVSTLG